MLYETPGIAVVTPNARGSILNWQPGESFAAYLYGRVVKEGVNFLSKVSIPNLVNECD